MKTMMFGSLMAATLMASAAPAVVLTSYEAAGVQQTSRAVTNAQVATFDGMSGWLGSGNLFAGSIGGTILQGGFVIGDANPYGGAGGAGKFATVFDTTTIQLSEAVRFVGLWASAIDGDFATSQGNAIALYSGGTLLGSYALKPLLAGAPSAYWGNPNANFAGQDASEPFAFFNFESSTGFDRIDIVQNGGGGFELDNITIGERAQHVPLDAVPEPASWVMMILGFGAIGAMLRSRRSRPVSRA